MQLPALEEYLSWPQPNYDNPVVRGPAILILTFIFIPLLVILVFLRVYTRWHLTRNFGPDDIAIVAAVIPTLACATITVIADKHYGWDRHVWDVPIDQLVMSLKLALVIEVLFSMACSLTRLSILLLVLRIMATGRGVLRYLAIYSIALMCIEELIFCVVTINTCSPVSDYWTLSFEPQQCINEGAHLLAAGIINTFNDFLVVFIPIPVVLKLRLPLRQRIFCAMLFGAGFIVCIAGGVRIAFLYQLNNTYDKTWLSYPTWICGTIELYLGIMATTFPTIKPLVARYLPNILGRSSSGHGLTSNGHMKSLEPYPERGSKSSVPGENSAFVRIPSPKLLALEKNLAQAKSRPLVLEPVVSAFSTYGRGESPRPISELKRLNPMEGESSNTSIVSFDTTWMPK